jgi:hypothetical protein
MKMTALTMHSILISLAFVDDNVPSIRLPDVMYSRSEELANKIKTTYQEVSNESSSFVLTMHQVVVATRPKPEVATLFKTKRESLDIEVTESAEQTMKFKLKNHGEEITQRIEGTPFSVNLAADVSCDVELNLEDGSVRVNNLEGLKLSVRILNNTVNTSIPGFKANYKAKSIGSR